MSAKKISRRDFLKLSAALPLLLVDWSEKGRLSNISHQDASMPNVIILLFDAFSARHLSMSGYPRHSTPNLARLTEKATIYHRHYTGGTFTTPGTASIFMGTYPWSHRAFHLEGTVIQHIAENNIFSSLPDEVYTVGCTQNLLSGLLLYQYLDSIDRYIPRKELLPGVNSIFDPVKNPDRVVMQLSEKKLMFEALYGSPFGSFFYHLASVMKEWSSIQKNEPFYPRGLPKVGEYYIFLEDAIDYLAKLMVELPQPHFLYYHLLPPHSPYSPREEFIGIFDQMTVGIDKPRNRFSSEIQFKDLEKTRLEYDEFIAFVDAEFGRLYDQLERAGVLENTYLIITSDHGEMFERGIQGHFTPVMYEPLIHIPLIIFKPGQTEREDVYTPTSNVDLLPTLLHLYNQPLPEWCEGHVLPNFDRSNYPEQRSVFVVDAKQNYKTSPITVGTSAIIKDPYKLVWYQGYGGSDDSFYELFDLSQDPEELEDLYTSQPSTASELLAELMERQRRADEPYMK